MFKPPLLKWGHFQPDIILLNEIWYYRHTSFRPELENLKYFWRLPNVFLSLGIWTLSTTHLQSVQINKNLPSTSENSQLSIALKIIEEPKKTSNLPIQINTPNTKHSVFPLLDLNRILIASPDNFNPSLTSPPPPPPRPPKPKIPPVIKVPKIPKPEPESEPETSASTTPTKPRVAVETNFDDDLTKLNQNNRINESTFSYNFPNGQSMSVRTGYDTFVQPKSVPVNDIPIQIGWQGKIDDFKIKAAAGVDIFDRLSPAPNLNLEIDKPIYQNLNQKKEVESSLTLSGIVEHGPNKSGVQTLERHISSWHTGLNALWQITPSTTLSSLYRIGFYNDGNFEQQSFTRLEQKVWKFHAAANLFTWSFNKDLQEASGYFSPKSFVAYNGEVGFETKLFKFLNCKANANMGRQNVNGSITGGITYQTGCTVELSPNLSFDFDYTFGKVINLENGKSPFNNRNLSGQFHLRF